MPHCLILLVTALLISPLVSAWTFYLPEQSGTEIGASPADIDAVPSLSLGLQVGQRRDDFSYRIGFDNPGPGLPDVLSELDWQGMQLLEVGVQLSDPRPGWAWRVEASHARSYDGQVRDSDWAEPGRQQEFSRSQATTEGSTAGDVLVGVGYRQPLGERLALVPAIGVEQHRLHWRMRHAVQVISDPAAFPSISMPPVGYRYDARSHYRANYRGPWLGLGLELSLLPRLSLSTDWRRSRYDYRGAGDWALRSDFAHPESFRHDTQGLGNHWQLALRHEGRQSRLGLHYGRHDWRSRPGSDTTFFSNGRVGEIRLNDVAWRSEWLALSGEWLW